MIDIQAIIDNCEQQVCPVHGKNPKVTYEEDNLEITAFCEDFKVSIKEMFNEELRQALVEYLLVKPMRERNKTS